MWVEHGFSWKFYELWGDFHAFFLPSDRDYYVYMKTRQVIAGNFDKEFAELYHNERLCRQWKPQINVRIKRAAETGAIPFKWGSMSFRRARLIKPRNYSVQKLFSGSQVNTYVRLTSEYFNIWRVEVLFKCTRNNNYENFARLLQWNVDICGSVYVCMLLRVKMRKLSPITFHKLQTSARIASNRKYAPHKEISH